MDAIWEEEEEIQSSTFDNTLQVATTVLMYLFGLNNDTRYRRVAYYATYGNFRFKTEVVKAFYMAFHKDKDNFISFGSVWDELVDQVYPLIELYIEEKKDRYAY